MFILSVLQVSRIGFGCAGLSGIYNDPLSHEAGCSIIKEAFSKGVTFFDTSDFYGENHDNEIMIGKVHPKSSQFSLKCLPSSLLISTERLIAQ